MSNSSWQVKILKSAAVYKERRMRVPYLCSSVACSNYQFYFRQEDIFFFFKFRKPRPSNIYNYPWFSTVCYAFKTVLSLSLYRSLILSYGNSCVPNYVQYTQSLVWNNAWALNSAIYLEYNDNFFSSHFHIRTVQLDILKLLYSPTDTQVNCLKKQF